MCIVDNQPTEPAAPIVRLSDIDAVILEAAAKADLPKRGAHGFDGTEWLWIWSDTSKPAYAVEARIRGRFVARKPGRPLEEGDFDIDVIGFTWLIHHPEISWACTYGSLRLRPEMSADGFMTQIADWLNEAWAGAHAAIADITAVTERRLLAKDLLRWPSGTERQRQKRQGDQRSAPN